jgi:hypothetical protein
MKGIQGYSRPTPEGGVNVDVEAMLADAITVFKAAGYPKDDCVNLFSKIWDEVKVSVDTSRVRKQS